MIHRILRQTADAATGYGPAGWVLVLWAALALGCSPSIRLFPGAGDPLTEYTLEGEGRMKVLVISVRGVLSDAPDKGWVRTRPSVVEDVVSQLRKAEKDDRIRAVVLKIDSPGGTVTAGDLLYHEITGYQQRTGARVVAAMMNVAASGGYYISLPADHILAHPTTVTGSVGVIYLQPDLTGFMGKLGVDVDVYKTGRNKDMGAFFREPTEAERRIMEDLIGRLGDRFFTLVKRHRPVTEAGFETIATARIFLSDDALALGMIDEIGYLDDAVSRAKALARLPSEARVVVYRRDEFPDDTIYTTAGGLHGGRPAVSLVETGLPDLGHLAAGFYYLWYPGASHD
ncbi:signal peptide peptidase SppA [Desulfococcus sp.]|uniref:signal peptide peptidase SppA n=1 Tax=Desulfococcus sp. TaxID=2025834 RepID=UPI0035941269